MLTIPVLTREYPKFVNQPFLDCQIDSTSIVNNPFKPMEYSRQCLNSSLNRLVNAIHVYQTLYHGDASELLEATKIFNAINKGEF